MDKLQITINGETIPVDEECAGCRNFYDLMCHIEGYCVAYFEYYICAIKSVELGIKCDDWQQRQEEGGDDELNKK